VGAPTAPPKPPREPYDWSWLAEHQANLFLFAGAFLTVIAALIYVGYSGQAVGGALKMALLVGYTLAFLAAGWFCLRVPRVELAGRVFFAIGAVLVPMNFAVAREIFGNDANFTRESMWLAGSITTAAFYTAVAWIGLGRPYAYGAGAALMSAAIAAPFATEAPFEWAPLFLIAVALLMVLTEVIDDDRVRERVGFAWGLEGRGLAMIALGWLLIAAVRASFAPSEEGYVDAETLWFLPVAFLAFAAASAVPMLLTRLQRERKPLPGALLPDMPDQYILAALASLAAAGVTIAYALDLPGEGWILTSAATAAYFGLMLVALDEQRGWLPARTGTYVFGFGIGLTVLAGFLMAAAYVDADGDIAQYGISTRRFLAVSCGLALAFYAMAGATRQARTDRGAYIVSLGGMISLAGGWLATMFAFDWPAEAYAVGIAGFAALLGTALVSAQDGRVSRALPAHLLDIVYITGFIATVTAGVVAISTLMAAERDIDPYEIRNRWFLFGTFALSFVFYAIVAPLARSRTREASMLVSSGSMLALAGAWLAVPYALDWPAEAYAVTTAAFAPALAIALVAMQDRRIAERLPVHLADTVLVTMVLATAAGAVVALFTLAASGDEIDPYDVRSRWFLFGTFAMSLSAYVIAATLSRARQGNRSLTISVGAIVALAGAWIAVPYALDWPAEAYAFAIGAFAAAAAVGLVAAQQQRIVALLPEHLPQTLFAATMAATAIAAGVAWSVLAAADSDVDAYDIRTRWFLPGTLALALAAYAIIVPLERSRRGAASLLVTTGTLSALIGTWLAVIYAFEWPAEAYSIGIAAMAPTLGLALVAAQYRRIARFLPEHLADASYGVAAIATLVSVFVAIGIIAAADREVDAYSMETRWFVLAGLGLSTGFYAIDALSLKRGLGVHGFVIFLTGCALSTVYALDVSAEYYAFAFIVPALALVAAVRFSPARVDELLGASWRDDVVFLVRNAVAGGMFWAFMAAVIGADDGGEWAPQSHAFLPAAFFAAAVALGLDASRGRQLGTSLACLAALGAAVVALPYAFEAHAAYYGVALVAVGTAYAAARRVYTPSWLDTRARDGLALLGISVATLPFLGAYADRPMIGAAVHITAAFVFAVAAVRTQGGRTLAELIDVRGAARIPLTMGWLYAAGLSAGIGYILVVRAVAGDERAEGGSLAFPMLTVAIGMIAAGFATKFWRPELRYHFYAMSLVAAIAAIATSDDAGTLAAVLTVSIVAYAIVAAVENVPALALPSVVFGFIAVPVWRAYFDSSEAVLPIAYSLIAVGTYGAALVARDMLPRWSLALRATGATFALVAPAAGFGVLAAGTDNALFDGEPFEQTALYQFSTAAVAAVGVLALVESLIARRRWIIVPASAVLAVALLLQIGSIRPENIQAYTAVIGAYLVLLGVVGISRMRLVPRLNEYAVYIEALGAATIMLPSFAQSLDGGWRYQWILLVESTVFLAGAIAMRRRGILATSALFMVLVSGRLLFDALNAMPNWIVVALCGIGLLAIGVGILLGRERWDRWQRTLVALWEETADDDAALAH
jgi:hypothetical protein